MKRLLSFGLLMLLLYHTLATVWVAAGVWWHEQHDLSQRLTIYSSVDSMVDFQIVLEAGQAQQLAQQTTEDGFTYHNKFYNVISVDLRGDTLHIAGMENKTARFWPQDLLSFVQKTIGHTTDTSGQKAGHWLKLLLKEYQPADRLVFTPSWGSWLATSRPSDRIAAVLARSLAVLAPPPRG